MNNGLADTHMPPNGVSTGHAGGGPCARGSLRLRVSDEGTCGARVEAHGVTGLADRVGAMDGRPRLGSPPGGPPVITVELPSTGREPPMWILIAEDSAVVLAGLAEILADSGHAVAAAVGSAGWRCAASATPRRQALHDDLP
jgi:hypothetical protein